MDYVQLIISRDRANDVVYQLGEFGQLHVVDMSPQEIPSKESLEYKRRIVDCQFWEKKLMDIRNSLPSCGVAIPGPDVKPQPISHLDLLARVQSVCGQYEATLDSFRTTQKRITEEIQVSLEYIQLLQAIREHIGVGPMGGHEEDGDVIGKEAVRGAYGSFHHGAPMDGDHEESSSLLLRRATSLGVGGDVPGGRQRIGSNVHGVLRKDEQDRFYRMLYRLARGNVYVRFVDMRIPSVPLGAPGQKGERKVAFTVYCLVPEIERRVRKVCLTFGATTYSDDQVPHTPAALTALIKRLEFQVGDNQLILAQSMTYAAAELSKFAWGQPSASASAASPSSPLVDMLDALKRERLVADTLRKANYARGSTVLELEGWVPRSQVSELDVILQRSVPPSEAVILHVHRTPATGKISQHAHQREGEDDDAGGHHQHGGHEEEEVKGGGGGEEMKKRVNKFRQVPPTFFRLNKFTAPFQAIVDTYGVPRYKEINPGLFTIITFPFLFGVMYGDVFHGSFLFLFASMLIYHEKSISDKEKKGNLDEISRMAFGGRYLLVMMGAFALYCGTIYNDCASLPLQLFSTTWKYEEGQQTATWSGEVYPYGLDPSWFHTNNELAFFNSFKMKLSVVFGVVQMTFGIFLSLGNHIYFRDSIHIWFEFVPRLLFLVSTFGYMIFLIIFKFCIDWTEPGRISPPNLVQTMIEMFLSPGNVDPSKQLYPHQGKVQFVLLATALLSVPVMLFGVPFMEKKHFEAEQEQQRRSKQQQRKSSHHGHGSGDVSLDEHRAERASLLSGHDHDDHDGPGEDLEDDDVHPLQPSSDKASEKRDQPGGKVSGESFPLGDHLIHQGIHTIEFVLGTVSNTASYLRLWALSLAHAQLSSVFFSRMIMQYGIKTGSATMTAIGIGVWFGATFAVLLCMDVLECFLHALRLHWVEFQNKFYYADGYAFAPMSFHA